MMQAMTYESRARVIFGFLYREPDGVLRRYRVPDHLGNDQLRAEINDLVNDINEHIPSGYSEADLRNLLVEIRKEVRRRQTSQNWPLARVFIAATEDAVAKINSGKANERKSAVTLDDYQITAMRMQAGAPVGENYLWGIKAVALAKTGLVDPATIAAYRKGAIHGKRMVYGEEAANAWEADANERHAAAEREDI